MVIDLGEQITNQPLAVSSHYVSSVDGLLVTSLTLDQSDITIIPDEDAGSGTAGVQTSNATPAFVADGNGYLTYELTETDCDREGGCTITISPAGAFPVVFRVRFVAELSTAQLGKLGTPESDNLAADIANVKVVSDAIQLKTDNLPASPAETGGQMALTLTAQSDLVAALEAEIADDATGAAIKQAIVDKLLENLPDIDDLSLSAIANSCRDAILNRVLLGNHDTPDTVGKLLQDLPDTTYLANRTLDSADYASSAGQTTILNRLGTWTGSGFNTILGAFRALVSKAATTPSDLTGDYDSETDSLEALSDAVASIISGPLAEHGEEIDQLQETTEEIRSLVATGIINVLSHQLPGNSIILVRGDAYLNAKGRALRWINTTGEEWPDTLPETINFTAIHQSVVGKERSEIPPEKIIQASCVAHQDTAPNQEVRCDLVNADTSGKALGLYNYDVECLVAGEPWTLVTTSESKLTGLASLNYKKPKFWLELLEDYTQISE